MLNNALTTELLVLALSAFSLRPSRRFSPLISSITSLSVSSFSMVNDFISSGLRRVALKSEEKRWDKSDSYEFGGRR